MTEKDSSSTGLDRLTAFSDGVFAIAITLLVLPLADAEIDPNDVTGSLEALIPRGFTFALSFAVIGRYWIMHHDDLRRLVRSDTPLLVLNLVFLFCIAFLPFPTSVLGVTSGGAAPVVLYAANLIAASVAAGALWWYATIHRTLVDPETTTPARARAGVAGSVAAVISLLPSIPLAFVDPTWAKFSWLLLIPTGFVADRLFPDGSAPRRRQ